MVDGVGMGTVVAGWLAAGDGATGLGWRRRASRRLQLRRPLVSPSSSSIAAVYSYRYTAGAGTADPFVEEEKVAR